VSVRHSQASVTGGLGGAGAIIRPTEAALAATPGANGRIGFVLSQRGEYVASSSSTLALAAGLVLANPAGGRWLRTEYADPAWAYGITDAYIDDVLGTTEATGLYTSTPGVPAPITSAEFARRWRNQVVSTGDLVNFTTRIFLQSAIAGNLDLPGVVFAPDTYPQFIAAPITPALQTSTLDAVGGYTAQVPGAAGGGTPVTIVDSTLASFAAFVGKRIRFPATGAIATILTAPAASTAELSQPNDDGFAVFNIFPTAINPAAGAAYVIEDLLSIKMGDWRASVETNSVFSGFEQWVSGKDFEAADDSGNVAWAPSIEGAPLVLYSCRVRGAFNLNGCVICDNCTMKNFTTNDQPKNGVLTVGAQAAILGGAFVPDPGVTPLLYLTGAGLGFGVVDNHVAVQAGGVVFVGDAMAGNFAVFDTAAAGVLNPGGHAVQVGAAAHSLGADVLFRGLAWGNGAVGHGMRVQSGSKGHWQTIPNVFGAAGELRLADSVIGFWFDPLTGTFQPPGGITPITWASVAAAAGVAGFGGSVHWPDQAASFVEQAAD
jgi:hypothetical protein